MPRLGLGLNTFYSESGAQLRSGADTTTFISTWTTTGSDETVTLPFVDDSNSISFTIDWGDGGTDDVTAHNDDLGEGAIDHVYGTADTYTITISGTISGLQFNNGGDRTKIKTITQWGTCNLSTNAAFYGCSALEISATDAPTVSTTSLFGMFRDCSTITGIGGEWDIDGVTNLQRTFDGCTNFNGDITTWDTAEVTTFREIFQGAAAFNKDITRDGVKWDTGEVTNFYLAFEGCTAFNGDIGNWDVAKGTNFNSMFVSCTNFNQDIDSWNVSAGTDFAGMFASATSFNQSLNSWTLNTSNIAGVSLVSMFSGSTSFNGNITSWNVSRVTGMKRMFKNANAFNQDLSAWDFDDVTGTSLGFNEFMNGKTGGNVMSTANYNALLVQIEASNAETNLVFDGGGAEPTGAGDTARATLITRGWTITDADT